MTISEDGVHFDGHFSDEEKAERLKCFEARMRDRKEGTSQEIPKGEAQKFIDDLPTFNDVDETATDTWLLDGIIPLNAITCLYGRAGLGKSHVIYHIGKAIQEEEKWFGHKVEKLPVLYLDYEMTENRRGQIKRVCGGSEVKVWATISSDKTKPAPPQVELEGFGRLKELSPYLMIFDTLRASTSMNIQDDTEAAKLMNKLKELCAVGHTVILLLHTLKKEDRKWKGNQVIMDLSDHSIALFKVKAEGETKEEDEDEDLDKDSNKPITLFFGTLPDDKSRYPKQKMWLKFDPSNLNAITLSGSPKAIRLEKAKIVLEEFIKAKDGNRLEYPNQSGFEGLIVEQLSLGSKKARALIKTGEEELFWSKHTILNLKKRNHIYYNVGVKE